MSDITVKEQIEIQLDRIANSEEFKAEILAMQDESNKKALIQRIQDVELTSNDVRWLVDLVEGSGSVYSSTLNFEYTEALQELF